jgi:SAM-dependent methyltransferase
MQQQIERRLIVNENETQEFWRNFPKSDLEQRCAALHQQRREFSESIGSIKVEATRRTVGQIWIQSGVGVEVGAGSRPFPIPDGARIMLGDILTSDQLEEYFKTKVTDNVYLDFETMNGIENNSLDFIIAAHVIEHVFNPIGAIDASLKKLKKGGVLVLCVPDMRFTFDVNRTPTDFKHLMEDYLDGGEGTKLQAYIEHVRFVHPVLSDVIIDDEDILEEAKKIMAANLDIHVHCWTFSTFLEMLKSLPFDLKTLSQISVENENIFVIEKQ